MNPEYLSVFLLGGDYDGKIMSNSFIFQIKNMSNFIVDCSVFPEELKVTANISVPHLMMSGDYVVIGEFQMLPVESTGKMAANFSKLILFLNDCCLIV